VCVCVWGRTGRQFERGFSRVDTSESSLFPFPPPHLNDCAGSVHGYDSTWVGASTDDKVQFAELFKALRPHETGEVVEMLQQRCPQALKNETEDEMEIAVHAIDAATMTELLKMCRTAVEERATFHKRA